jgi:hypothetical protein
MIERRFFKAQAAGDAIESVTLMFYDELPNRPLDQSKPLPEALAEARVVFEKDAKILAQTLLKVLPGGTFDQLLCEMLQIKASHFRVTF